MAFTFAEIFGCGTNPGSQWGSSDLGHCINLIWLNFAFSITDTLGDILVVVIPFPCIRKLHLDTRHKVMLLLIFAFGTLGIIINIIRLYFVSVALGESFGDLAN